MMMPLVRVLMVAATLVLAATTPATAGVVYTSEPSNTSGSFELTASDFITIDTTFLAADLDSCSSQFGTCTSVTFYVDAFASGLTGVDLDLQGVGVSAAGSTEFYYFSEPAFTTPGIHPGFNSGRTLTVTQVPEPGSHVLTMLGLVSLAWLARRRVATLPSH